MFDFDLVRGIDHRLRRIERALGAIASAMFSILEKVSGREGGLTPEELSQVLSRLDAHSQALEGIAAGPPSGPTSPPGMTEMQMAVPQQLTDVMRQLDERTNALAGVVDELRARVKTGMSQQDVDTVQAALDQIATHLEAIGKDPNNPVPPGPLPAVKP